jgi:hypothetical protein
MERKKAVWLIGDLDNEAARVGEFSERINSWNFLLSNEGNYLLAPNQ